MKPPKQWWTDVARGVLHGPASLIARPTPPPRIWWDGSNFLVLAPRPYIDDTGRSTMPMHYRAETLADIPADAVELYPHPGPSPDPTPLPAAVAAVIAIVLFAAAVILAVAVL